MPHEDTISDDLTRLVGYVESSEEATEPARKDSERNRDYYDNKQWSAEETALLKKRGQAAVVFNRIKPKVDFLRGVERRLRTDPKAYPRTPVHEQDADGATDSIRFVCDNNDWDYVRSAVWDNLVIEGYGGADVVVEQLPNGKLEIKLQYVPWDRLGYDPHSREPDFSDALYKFIVIWMDIDEAMSIWPDREDVLSATMNEQSISDTYDDKPVFRVWSDNKRRRVRVVQMHENRPDGWEQSTITKGGFLDDPQPSPYMDEFGRPESSLIMASAFIDRDNNRYGYIQTFIWPQDEINKRRSKALHAVNSRRVISDGTASTGDGNNNRQAIRNEVARPDAYIEVAPNGRFEVQENGELAAGQVALLQDAHREIDLQGPNAAMQGDVEGESGRAIQAKQQGGFVELEPMTDAHRRWSRATYRAVWNRIRQFWTEERWIRVTDDERNLRWVAVNRPVTLGDQIGQLPPEEQAAAMQQIGTFPDDPRLDAVAAVENEIAELDVDISLDDGPDIVTLRDEQFDKMFRLFEKGVLPPDMADLLIESSDLRNKEAILERMRGNEDAQAEQAEDAKVAKQEERTIKTLTMSGAAAEVDLTRAKVVSEKAKATEDMADTNSKTLDAALKRRQLRLGI
jgi:hypothetical protein